MSESSQVATAAVPAEKPSDSFWERLVDDIHRRPQHYLQRVFWLGAAIALLVIGWRVFSAFNATKQDELASAWNDATDSEKSAKQRAAQLEDLAARTKESPADATRLFELAATNMDVADEAKTQEEKIASYQKAIAACDELLSKHPNSLWCKLLTHTTSGAPGAGGSVSAVSQLKDTAQRQLDWLKAHPFVGTVAPDKNLKVTVELDNGKKFVISNFRSKLSPFHVKNFVWLARDKKYFDGTAFYAFVKGVKKSDAASMMMRQPKTSNLGINAGDPMTKATPENRDDDGQTTNDVGYSVREETNMLVPTRGSVVSVMDYTTGGDSPSRFSIFADEPNYPQGTVFAEVTEGLEVIDELVAQPADDPRADRPKALVRIKSMTVEGDVEFPPEDSKFPPVNAFKEPEKKAPESKATTQPDTRATQPESR